MSTAAAATPSDPVATFNAHLAQAKINALRLLQDLMASLTDPEAPVGAAIREIRLAATAILRTQPIHPATSPPSPPGRGNGPAQRGRGEGVRRTPCEPAPPPPPTYRPNLNPTARAARNDIRELIRAGVPEVVNLFLSPRHTTQEHRAPIGADG